MATIPLEDSYTDILGKTQRGLKLSDDALAKAAGVSVEALRLAKNGGLDEEVLRKLAGPLQLGPARLVASARKSWQPEPIQLRGLSQFNTPYDDMTVNSYLVWRPDGKDAVAVDTGADCKPMLDFAKANSLQIRLILLTHIHPDHILALADLKAATGAPARVSALEPTPGAEPFDLPQTFRAGGLEIEARLTSGHATGGITYVVSGLERPVAIVGDALFAGSMGGGMISFADALANNRRQILTLPDSTVVCAGHGPLTTVGEEKRHNPFYPEFS
ncbi:MAG: hydroxyacylglutathione hydrolase [Verrucomicrobiota bacterium]|jgi:glyoxylase-like metal-dependent hydrolase (beta-lactamase superfamily II)